MKGRTGKVFSLWMAIFSYGQIRGALSRKFGRRLEIHRLPAYAPDLNPDEFV